MRAAGIFPYFKSRARSLRCLGLSLRRQRARSNAQQGNLLYVVNAGGASDLVGFRLTTDGHLKQIAGSTTYLSTGTSEPGSAIL